MMKQRQKGKKRKTDKNKKLGKKRHNKNNPKGQNNKMHRKGRGNAKKKNGAGRRQKRNGDDEDDEYDEYSYSYENSYSQEPEEYPDSYESSYSQETDGFSGSEERLSEFNVERNQQCLKDKERLIGEKGLVLGWGKDEGEDGELEKSDVLREVKMTVISTSECMKAFK